MGLVPCPNNGACGSRSHNQKSARYRECLASARFSGRGTSVRGMVVPKASSSGKLDMPLSDIRGYEDRITVTGENTGDIEVWRGWYDGQIRAKFQVKADLGKQLEAAGYVRDANDQDDVLDAIENGDEYDLWDQIEAFYGMEHCDMPGGFCTDSFVGTLVIDDDEASTMGDVVDIVNEVAFRAESESTALEFGDFVRSGKLNKQTNGVQR